MRKKSWRNFLNGPDNTIKKKFSMKHTDFQPTISIVIFWRKSCWLRGCYTFFNKSNCSIINVQILRPCRKPFKSATVIEKQWMRTVISAKREQSQMSHLIASCDTFFQTRTALFCVNKAMSCQVIPPSLLAIVPGAFFFMPSHNYLWENASPQNFPFLSASLKYLFDNLRIADTES